MGNNDSLAQALDDYATAIENSPPVVIGSQVTVTAGPGSGNVIGKSVSVTAGPGSTGNVIGEQVTVTAGGPNPTPPVNNQRAAALHEAGQRVRAGEATKADIRTIINQSRLPASVSPIANAASMRAMQALEASDLP
jgi:hypothetical protein